MSIFPLFSNSQQAQTSALPLAREIARDPATGQTIWRGGAPVIVTGAEAVASWALAALHSRRCTSAANSKRYGSEFHSLVGNFFTEDVKTAVVPNILRDTLLQNPYITGVENITTEFSDGRLSCGARLKTIYGEVAVHVSDN